MACFMLLINLLVSSLLVNAAVVTYDFDITWTYANPDGQFTRAVHGINGKWPLPTIEVTKGDQVIINVNNKLGNESTSLHFHGLYQNGTPHMDGPIGGTQCPILTGESFTYNFTVDQPGTYWYHSHMQGQYPDGLRAPLIVNDPDFPYKDQIDGEFYLSLSDWYHDPMPELLKFFISVANPTGAEPVPNSSLMNETRDLKTMVEPGKTYMLRLVNMGAFAAQYFWIEGHEMSIVEVDGIYTEPTKADLLYLTSAQRYSVLITTKNETSANFPFMTSMDEDLFDKVPNGLNPNCTGWLVYDQKASFPEAAPLEAFEPFDDFTLIPYDKQPLLEKVDHTITLDVAMDNLIDGANYAFFNDITYVKPKVPTLYTVLSTGASASNATVYGTHTNPFVLEKDQVIEVVVNNHDPGKHPFHLHGHDFQTVVRSAEEANDYVKNETFPAIPMRRDTVMVRPNGNIVLRFRANNPEWHVASGLSATFIEDPQALQSLVIPPAHYEMCKKQNIPIVGNAAANNVDFFDLTGESSPPAKIPAGFTSRGIVALVFSIIAALLGIAMIAWYGSGEFGKKNPSAHFLHDTAGTMPQK